MTERKDRQTGPCPFYNVDCEYVPMAHRTVELENEIERLRGLLKDWVDCCFVNFATDTIEIVDVGKVYAETRAALKGDE